MAAKPHCCRPQLLLIESPALPPTLQQTPTAQQELKFARKPPPQLRLACDRAPGVAKLSGLKHELLVPRAGDVLEFAVLSSVKHKDDAGFVRNYSQLRTYYADTRCRETFRTPQQAASNVPHTVCQNSCTFVHEPAPLPRRSLLPPSDTELLVTGLNLLRLLVQNRIAEFHTELELLPQQVVLRGPCSAFVRLQCFV